MDFNNTSRLKSPPKVSTVIRKLQNRSLLIGLVESVVHDCGIA